MIERQLFQHNFPGGSPAQPRSQSPSQKWWTRPPEPEPTSSAMEEPLLGPFEEEDLARSSAGPGMSTTTTAAAAAGPPRGTDLRRSQNARWRPALLVTREHPPQRRRAGLNLEDSGEGMRPRRSGGAAGVAALPGGRPAPFVTGGHLHQRCRAG